jgi:hypothetical protein
MILKGKPSEENQILTQLLGINKLQAIGSQFMGTGEIHLNIEPTVEVAACPDCGKISLQEHN